MAAAEAAAVAAAADATAGNLKISTKKRRQVGSPLLVLSGTLHFFPYFSRLTAPARVLETLRGFGPIG